MNTNQNFKASKTPLEDIEAVSYPGQPAKMKQYRAGYEQFLEAMPILVEDDPLLQTKIDTSVIVMKTLGNELKTQAWLVDDLPPQKGFNRTIIAMEESKFINDVKQDSVELIVAKWGNGMASPIHGHSTGFLHEEILYGKIKVNQYRLVDPKIEGVVRPVRTDLITEGVFISLYTPPDPNAPFKRQSYIHNFESIGPSASLHYIPEHTRDGRDNTFKVENFEDVFPLKESDVTRITAKEGLYSRIGDVILVRSTNVPYFGDHFIVITGKPVMKDHGLRPEDVAIPALQNNHLLNQYDINETGLVLLRLNGIAREEFLEFHAITIENGDNESDRKVIFPQA